MDYPSSSTWWDEDFQIIRHTTKGVVSLEVAEQIEEEIFRFLDQRPHAGILVEGKDLPAITRKAGETFQAAFSDPRITRVAFLNVTPVIKFDIDYLAHTHINPLLVLKKFKLFTNEDLAIKWLRKK